MVKQGEVFYVTEMLARLEGRQRGPAGNTSLTAAIALAKELPKDSTIVVQETEYTGAGKAPSAQLTFARKNGVKVIRGDPLTDDVPGKVIAIPENPSQIMYTELGLDRLRESYIRELIKRQILPSERDLDYLAQELRLTTDETARLIKEVSR